MCSWEGLSGREALWGWCKKHTQGHNVALKDFSSSFQDGVAFCAMIHYCSPDTLDFAHLNKYRNLQNLNKAFGLAESKWGVKPWLDAADFVSPPDDFCICLYLTQWVFFVLPEF